MLWSLVAFDKPSDPRDPDDPAYNWTNIDKAIIGADKHGFDVDLTVSLAPSWAEGANRPSREIAPAGSWKPDPVAFGDFAHAVARRYSGSYTSYGIDLPAVKYFEAWNEPNLSTYITPQWQGNRNVSSDIYVRLLNGFYDGIKDVDPGAKVVSGGTAPYGDPPGGKKTGPLRFYREILCLNSKLQKGPCAAGQRPKFDIAAHHPINREDPPTQHAAAKDDVEIADFGELRKTLRRAERLHTPATDGPHGLWANEVWWQTNPPDRDEGVPLKTQARWMAQALYLLWKQGASNVSFLQLRDAKYTPGEPTLDSYQTGIYTYRNQRKPSANAIAFPFVTDRKGKHKLLAWGKAPRSGRLVIEAKRGKKFRQVATEHVNAGEVFTHSLRGLGGKQKLRARVGGKTSPVWTQRD
jgi:hypothetical protein